MSQSQPTVFISYSRKDIEFARRLFGALKASGQDAWIDWEDISYSDDFWKAICKGIDSAQNFVFIISPDSLSSRVCNLEIEYARSNNKRIIPVVRREADIKALAGEWFGKEWEQTARDNWTEINKLNYIFFRKKSGFDCEYDEITRTVLNPKCDGPDSDADNFETSFQNLLITAAQDPAYLSLHTRLLVRAKEWDTNRDSSLLLRGDDLRQAESWLEFNAEKNPPPTDLHRAYIQAGIEQRTRDEQAEKQTARRLRNLAVGLAVFLLLAIGALGFAVNRTQVADTNAATAVSALATSERQAAEAQSVALAVNAQRIYENGDPFRALPLALAANEMLMPTPPALAQSVLADVAYAPGQRRQFVGHTSTVQSVAFSPDGGTALSGSADNTLILWDVATGARLRQFVGHTDWVNSVAFSPDGRTALSGSADDTLILWHIDSPEQLIAWTYENRAVRPLTCEERQTYNVQPLCIDGTPPPTPTFMPTRTPYPTATIPVWTPIPSPTPSPAP